MIPISKPFITEAEKDAVMEVLESGMLAQGHRTAELENRCAEVCGTKYAIATSSGTTALHLALLAHGLGLGDEVITTPFTFIASVNSILFVSAKPRFVDIEEETFNINPTLVEEAITPSTRALMPVHLYGHACDMGALMEIAQRHNLIVIEDCAQAIGAKYEGKSVGSFGTGVFSLYATKNVMSGEGGIITTNDSDLANKCRLLRNHGMKQKYYHEMLGYNFRMSDLHAAIGFVQINRIEEMTQKRRANASFLNENITSVITPKVKPYAEHVWHQYTVRVDGGRDRDVAAQKLNQVGIGTGIFYPVPVHKQKYMHDIIGDITLPIVEQIAKEVVSLPIHPLLSDEDLELIVNEVNKL
jgi:dTDP-4-amino-4,6-dideoxygalactose transaminase